MPDTNNLKNSKILFIGGGHMAANIVGGLCSSDLPAHNIFISERNNDKLQDLKNKYKINAFNSTVKSNNFTADIVVLAVKPKDIQSACHEITPYLTNRTLVISVAAGVKLENIKKWLDLSYPIYVFRSMPNLPSSLQMGMTILYTDKTNTDSKAITQDLFNCIGHTIWVETEDEINTTMALSGCGPGYIFLFIECLTAAAKELDINPEVAKKLISTTILGTTQMYSLSSKEAETLRKEVATPGGTTEAIINNLDPENLKKIFTTSLQAAVSKAQELENSLN